MILKRKSVLEDLKIDHEQAERQILDIEIDKEDTFD